MRIKVFIISTLIIALFIVCLFFSFGNPLNTSLKDECLKLSEEDRISKDCFG